ncbi:uncharacterized protein LOC135348740 isoform X2 [Halichondria panicea]|uniref:uncharacterized protein LOC135348740 isoform X2 n=1 Tax=Halichondria panicea TaxID=6063 RepID=UPI00312B597D
MSSVVQLFLLILLTISSVNSRQLTLVYTAEYIDDLVVITLQNADEESTDHVPNLGNLAASQITISDCTPGTPSQDGLLPAVYTLITVSSLSLSSSGIPTLSLSVPSYLGAGGCLEVVVQPLWLRAGLIVLELKRIIKLTTESRNSTELFCPTGQCEVLDTSWLGWGGASLVRNLTNGAYSLVHYDQTSIDNGTLIPHPLPRCLDNETSMATTWRTVVTNETTCREVFTPSRVFVASKRSVFVVGNGLLYSPDDGTDLYQLVTPDYANGRVLSFAVSLVGRMFSMILPPQVQNASTALYFGFVGSSTVSKLYPSSLLDHLLELGYDLNLTAGSVTFDNGQLYLTIDSSRLRLPLEVLLNQESNRGALTFTQPQQHRLLRPRIHNLTTGIDECPYQDVRIEAPVCGRITRTTYFVERVGVLRWTTGQLSATTNCSIMADRVPTQIFLKKWDNYKLRVHFEISPTFNDPAKLLITPIVSDPDTVQVTITSIYNPISNIVSFTIVMTESGRLSSQWSPGAVAVETDLTLNVWGSQRNCIDVYSNSPLTPDYIETTVHVGCPPGLSLTFDPVATHSQFEQHCQSTANISCYYFRHEFRPVFKLVDVVTSQENIYSGLYTLRALSGGVDLSEMTQFQPSQQVEMSIWTPVNSSKKLAPVYHYGDNAIRWACSTTSPCGEIIPRNAKTSEYYLLIEASNWCARRSLPCW